MPVFPDPAGGSMTVANEAEARARGWTPSMGSFGVNSYPTGGGGGGGGGVPQVSSDTAALQKFFGQTAGFSREELAQRAALTREDLAERARQFNEQMALAERQWIREGLPRLEIDQRLQTLRERQAEAEIADQEGRLGVARGTLALNYLTQASNMGGPSDVFQAADFYRGAQQRGDLPVFLRALGENTQLPSFTGAGGVTPEAQTAAGVAARLTGAPTNTSTGGYNMDQALNAIGSIFKRGVTGLAPNALEQLNPSEVGVLQSGAKKLGYDWNDWLKSYQASRIGQSAAAPV